MRRRSIFLFWADQSGRSSSRRPWACRDCRRRPPPSRRRRPRPPRTAWGSRCCTSPPAHPPHTLPGRCPTAAAPAPWILHKGRGFEGRVSPEIFPLFLLPFTDTDRCGPEGEPRQVLSVFSEKSISNYSILTTAENRRLKNAISMYLFGQYAILLPLSTVYGKFFWFFYWWLL